MAEGSKTETVGSLVRLRAGYAAMSRHVTSETGRWSIRRMAEGSKTETVGSLVRLREPV